MTTLLAEPIKFFFYIRTNGGPLCTFPVCFFYFLVSFYLSPYVFSMGDTHTGSRLGVRSSRIVAIETSILGGTRALRNLLRSSYYYYVVMKVQD
jgi:hypothetical protein